MEYKEFVQRALADDGTGSLKSECIDRQEFRFYGWERAQKILAERADRDETTWTISMWEPVRAAKLVTPTEYAERQDISIIDFLELQQL